MDNKVRFSLLTVGCYFIALGLWFLSREFTIIAVLVLLPGIAFLLLLLPIPPVFVIFAFLVEIAGPIHNIDESEYSYQLKIFRWWLLGSLVFPLSIVILALSRRYDNFLGSFEAVLILPLPAFGISCFLFSLKSLYQAIRIKYFYAPNTEQ